MFFAALISKNNLTPQSVTTTASVTLGSDDSGPCITHIKLVCEVACEGLTPELFDELKLAAKEKCPISRLYAGSTATIELDAKLVS